MNKEIEGYKSEWFTDGRFIVKNTRKNRRASSLATFFRKVMSALKLNKKWKVITLSIILAISAAASFFFSAPVWATSLSVAAFAIVVISSISEKATTRYLSKRNKVNFFRDKSHTVRDLLQSGVHSRFFDNLISKGALEAWDNYGIISKLITVWMRADRAGGVLGDQIKETIDGISENYPFSSHDFMREISELVTELNEKIVAYQKSLDLIQNKGVRSTYTADRNAAMLDSLRKSITSVNEETSLVESVNSELDKTFTD